MYGMSGDYMIYIGITIAFTLIGMFIGNRLKAKFKYYSQVPLRNGQSGAEVAATMLRDYGISDVQITQGQGFLTDHYNPLTKTVTLSPEVYQGRNVAAAAVAAHECGHAVQHAEAYVWLQLRSAIVPVVQISARLQSILLMFALGAAGTMGNGVVLLITIIAFMITAAFSLITLPVEFDASKRALAWLDRSGYSQGQEYAGAKDALWWAAMTYVVQALSALAILLFLVFRYMGANRN